MADLELGRKVPSLTLTYVPGDPAAFSLTLAIGAADEPWPAPPHLEFPDLSTITDWVATLSVSDAPLSVANAKASWSKDEAAMTALNIAADGSPTRVRLSVAGVTWWKGYTAPDA